MTALGWYARRLSRMGPVEVARRAGDTARKRRWRALPELAVAAAAREFGAREPDDRNSPPTLPAAALQAVPPAAAARVLATAEALLDGRACYFGVERTDMVDPDWSYDPKTGRRAPSEAYAFDIEYRDEQATGDIKQIWEPSRHQHLTVLATAYALTGDERYAQRVADHLKSWWAANPPLRGVHWTSGIELGIRLISWVWARRLLDGWRGAAGLFERNPEALYQVWAHQRWLAALPSHGSSANNHAVAEAAGLLVAACGFDWFAESPAWRAAGLRSLEAHLRRNTFDSGLNRELATEYHGLVLELGLAAGLETAAAGLAVPGSTWRVLLRMIDALAAVADTRLRPPRQGDADDGHGLVLDGHGTDRWASLLATGAGLAGRLDWWPEVPADDARSPLLVGLAGKGTAGLAAAARGPEPAAKRPARRPGHFADAGLSILRSPGETDAREIWCRCDAGPHGFLAIAAHAHADALSIELRHGGVDVLADPGTYCYHGQPSWRGYFRSTRAHNTLELDGADQSRSGGPFLWTRHARSRVLTAPDPPGQQDGAVQLWCGEHDGYSRLGRPVTHRRQVSLEPDSRVLRVRDELRTAVSRPCTLAYHLGPAISTRLTGNVAQLSWTADGEAHAATLELPASLSWSQHRGQVDPPLGWYSSGFGRKVAADTVLGRGHVGAGEMLTTVLHLPTSSSSEG